MSNSENHMTNYNTVSAIQFVTELVAIAPKDSAPIGCSFTSAPDIALEDEKANRQRWAGQPVDLEAVAPIDANSYVTISSFTGRRRRKVDFVAMLAVMIDDPGTKIDLDKIKLEPSVRLETSPGNYQFWYFLAEAETDRERAESVIKALIASDLIEGGKDPGMSSVSRYGRVPESVNNKTSLSAVHRVTGKTSNGVKRYTLDEIIEGFSLILEAPSIEGLKVQSSADSAETAAVFLADPVGAMFAELGRVKSYRRGIVDVVCPWGEEHSDDSEDGAAVLVNRDKTIGFKCHHGHCDGKGLGDIWSWARAGGHLAPAKTEATKINRGGSDLEDDEPPEGMYALTKEALSAADPKRAIADLKAAHPYETRIIQEYQKLIEDEQAKAEQRIAARLLLSNKDDFPEKLDLGRLLTGDGGKLAEAVKARAVALPTAEEFIFAPMIPVLASQMGTKHELLARKDSNQRATAIFWMLIVGKTGDAKSPAMKIATRALIVKEQASREAYAREERMAEAAKAAKIDTPPIPPRKRYMMEDSTPAARIAIHILNPTGYLNSKDEGSAFLSEMGRFSSKGSDNGETEALLSEFDGGALQYDRKGSNGKPEDRGISKTAVQRVGTTQWPTLKKLRGDHQDDRGLWARFLFCGVPTPLAIASYDSGNPPVDLEGMIEKLVTSIEKLAPAEYTYTDDARRLTIDFSNRLVHLGEDADDSEGSAYPKFRTYLHRFALFFHILNGVLGRDPESVVSHEVSAQSVEQAIYCLKFFIGQYRTVLNLNADDRAEAGHAEHLLRYLERKDKPLTLRQVVAGRCLQKRGVTTTVEYKYLIEVLKSSGKLIEQAGLIMAIR